MPSLTYSVTGWGLNDHRLRWKVSRNRSNWTEVQDQRGRVIQKMIFEIRELTEADSGPGELSGKVELVGATRREKQEGTD